MNEVTCKTISTITTTKKSKWNTFILRSPFSSIYFRYEFLKSIEEGTNFQPRHIVVTKDGNIIGVFPNFIQPIPNLPFNLLFSTNPGYGGPLINKHEHQVINLMMNQIKQICTKTILSHYIHTKHPGFIRYHHYFTKLGYKLNLRYALATISLQHKTYQQIKKEYHKARIYELNKMKQEDITITDEPITKQTLTSFHKEYKKTMQKVNGTPLPLHFFTILNTYLPNRLKLINITLNGLTLGQILYLLDNEQQTVTAWTLGIQPQHFKYHPSTLIHDYMIKWAIKHNYNTYDFGYHLADYHDGLFKYKQEFGTKQTPLLHWEKSYCPIPLPLLKKAGTLYKKITKPSFKK